MALGGSGPLDSHDDNPDGDDCILARVFPSTKVRLFAVALFVSWHSTQLADGQCLVERGKRKDVEM